MKTLVILILYTFLPFSIVLAQSYKDWNSYGIEEFYEKVDVKSGTLNEDGEEISFVFIPSEMKQGIYEVEITDFKNDLYQIKGTDYYVKFRSYYGYAGYGDEGVLVVNSSAWSSKFYKKP